VTEIAWRTVSSNKGRRSWLRVIENRRNQRKRRSKPSPQHRARRARLRVGNRTSGQGRRNNSNGPHGPVAIGPIFRRCLYLSNVSAVSRKRWRMASATSAIGFTVGCHSSSFLGPLRAKLLAPDNSKRWNDSYRCWERLWIRDVRSTSQAT